MAVLAVVVAIVRANDPHGWARFWLQAQVVGAAGGVLYGAHRARQRRPLRRWVWVALFLGALWVGVGLAVGYVGARWLVRRRTHPAAVDRRALPQRLAAAPDAFAAVRECAWSYGGGSFLGFDPSCGVWVGADPQNAVLVIGPPREGKTASLVIPSVLVAPGACVSTSVKEDVFNATWRARALVGRVWLFDPTGTQPLPMGVSPLRWSPVQASRTWDGAQLVAESMANTMAHGATGDDAHFVSKAKEFLAPLLYAAALSGRSVIDVSRWVLRASDPGAINEAGVALEDAAAAGDEGAEIAKDVLFGVLSTAEKERSGIVSTTGRLLRVYTTIGGRATARDPNFDVDAFVRSTDTIYITAPPDRQALFAPMIVGLLEQIRYATYRRHAAEVRGVEPRRAHVAFVLDEVANTAPLPLPAIISEAGGQGLHVLAATQDLSQARVRWGAAAAGFLTLFKVKVILPGVGDPQTLDAISTALGDYDRLMVSYGHSETPMMVGMLPVTTRTWSTNHSYQRQRVLSPGEIANIPKGHALVLVGAAWGLVQLTPYHAINPWPAVLDWSSPGSPDT
jgi:type IV secretion system protein VirD4